MLPLCKARYLARLATSAQDIRDAAALRHLCFIANRGLVTGLRPLTDADPHDAHCQHVVLEEIASGQIVCCYRLRAMTSAADVLGSYSAQFYDLTRLATYPGAMLELGRFCIRPGHAVPDILRLAWGALTRAVAQTGAKMLFGCSSFEGSDPTRHQHSLAMLARAHLAPNRWAPGEKSPQRYPFAELLRATWPDPKRAVLDMPPLLRSYLAMGGWVSDHAVIDRDLDTLHVFTGVEIAAIPPARARLLRVLAG